MPIDFVADEEKIDFQPEEPEFQGGLVGPKERRFSMYDVPALVDKLSESQLPTYGMDVPTESVPVALAKTVAGLGKGVVSPLGAAATAVAPVESAGPALKAGFSALGTKGIADILSEVIRDPRSHLSTPAQVVELEGQILPQALMVAAPFIPEVTAAAYKNPKTGEVTAGAFHKEAAAEQGVKAPEAKEARETPDYGFIVQDPKTGATEFKTRPETEPIAQASGQLVQEPERPGQPHSDDIAAPGTDTPIAETKVPEKVRQEPLSPDAQAEEQARLAAELEEAPPAAPTGEAPPSTTVPVGKQAEGVAAPLAPSAIPERAISQAKEQVTPTLTPSESTRLKSLTDKLESGKPLTSAEQKRYRALKDKVSPPEGEKPSVEAEKPETEPTPTTQAAAPTLFVKQGNRMKQVSPEQASEAMGTLRRKLVGFSKGQLSSIPLYDIRGKEIGHVSPNGNVWFGKMDDPLKNQDLILNKTGLVRTPEGTWDLPKPPRWNELRDVQDKLDAFRKKHRERSLGSDSSLAATYPEFAKLIKQRDEILADTYGSGKPDVDVSSTKSPTTPPSTGEGMAGPSPTELYAGVPVGLDKFIESDLKPLLKKGVDATKALSDVVVNWFSPASHTKGGDVDVLFESKGYAEQFKTKAAAAVEQANKMVGSLPEKDQIDFIDRVKRGEKQTTPELQTIADLLRKWDDRLYQEAKVYKPGLNYLDNHLRVLWKVVPGSPEAIGTSKTSIGSKRPWRGSQGFTRRHVLDDMSEGLDLGGVPVTYNPVEMFLLHAQDVMKFVSANRAWEALKRTGSVEFVREGKKPPEGFRRFDDPIAKPYFRTEEGLKAKPGEWWVDEGTARMLHNYLSRDYIRTGKFGPVGRGLLALKNATTAIELGLSPFHAVFESNETMASSLGLGIAKMASGKAREGINDIVSAGASPVTTAKLGGAAIRYAKDEASFSKNYPDAYKWFTDRYPEARQMIKDLFTGGGQVSMHEDYRIRARKGFEKAVAEGNYPGAMLRAIPALSELANKPLFETYIPRLKVGMFLREYAFELERNSGDLASGKITREALARKTWGFIEDRFGELNWDNLYWDRTFKTAMQLMFRSVTWKLGNIRGFGKAGRDIASEVGTKGTGDPIQMVVNQLNPPKGAAPKVTLPMAWVAGTALVTAIQSSIISKVSTGQYPWELAADAADLIKNLTFPRIDPKDPSQRVSIPTYLRDAVHMAHDPTGYVRSSMTGTWGRIADDWQNKDFYGRPVYNPLDPVQKRLATQFEHLIPMPFAVSSYQAATKTGASTERALAGFAGFTKAPGYISPSASSQVYDMAEKWMASSKIPALEEKVRRQAIKEERRADEPSAYQNLRSLLKAGDMQGAKEEYTKLLSAHKFVSIQNAMNPNRPFTGSFASEQKFKRSMTPAQRAIYESAIDERKTVLKRFREMTRSYHANRIRENP